MEPGPNWLVIILFLTAALIICLVFGVVTWLSRDKRTEEDKQLTERAQNYMGTVNDWTEDEIRRAQVYGVCKCCGYPRDVLIHYEGDTQVMELWCPNCGRLISGGLYL